MPPKKGAKARANRAKAAALKGCEKSIESHVSKIKETALKTAAIKKEKIPRPVFKSIISTRSAARKSAGPTVTPVATTIPPRKAAIPQEKPKLARATKAPHKEADTKDTADTTKAADKKTATRKTASRRTASKRAATGISPPAKATAKKTVAVETDHVEDTQSRAISKKTNDESLPKSTATTRETFARETPTTKLAITETLVIPLASLKRPAPVESPRPKILKKPRVESFRFANDDNDPIIESLKNMSKQCTQIRSLDSELLDHVALEGLTGITFSRLCLILDALAPALNSCQDDSAQNYIWVMINRYAQRVPGARIQIFYLDPTLPDEPEVNFPACDKKSFFIDKSIKLPDQTMKWLGKTDWMLHPVQDGITMGSCRHYRSRLNISDEVTTLHRWYGPRDSLLAVNEKYNLKNVYFVADQELRRRAILPMTYDPNMDIKLREYACLELIGQTRSYGIVFPNDKTLGRYRILLSNKALISQFQQTCNTFIIHHIRRFTQYSLGMQVAKAFKGGSDAKARANKDLKTNGDGNEDGNYDDEVPDGASAGGGDSSGSNGNNSSIRNTCCHPRRLKSDRDMLKMVYDVIASSKGRSMCDIRQKLKIPKHHARNHLKNLANIELIGSHTRIIFDKKTRIYRARHRSSRRKFLSRKRYIKGVRSKWDAVDVRARDMLGNRRSQFSQAEDSLLILCRIAGLLLQPNITKLNFIVPKQAIRDILHDELYESHDKTSDSLLRRTKFLRRMPSNVQLINELTAELRDDTDIVRLIGIKREVDESKSMEKMIKLFKQILRAIRAKLPHLLGLTSSLMTSGVGGAALSMSGISGGSSGGSTTTGSVRAHQFSSLNDLKRQFELIDCQVDSPGGGGGGASRGLHHSTTSYHQPTSTLVQLADSLPRDYRLEISKCSGMRTIMLLASCCVNSSFNLDLRLKVPVRVVGLDQDSENFKEMFEYAKGSKETSRLIANLTTPNPTADSRRALFMLRNALKLQTIDKCGKLADALVVQPCDITFSSPPSSTSPQGPGVVETIDQAQLVRDFLGKSRFINEFLSEDGKREEELRNGCRRRRRAAAATAATAMILDPGGQDQQQQATTSSGINATATHQPKPGEEPFDLKLEILLETIECAMSWISAMPGLELALLQRKLRPRLFKRNNGHLNEMLDLMVRLELVSRDSLRQQLDQEPRLFGYQKVSDVEGQQIIITYAPRENAYVRYCQLLELDHSKRPHT